MTYEVKHFQEEFLEKQYEIGNNILSNWKGAGQSNVENLKLAYSQPNFDPETKFYAFKDGELVGFMTSSIQTTEVEGKKIALMEFPIVKSEHTEAIDLLFNKGLETLKRKGVEAVRTRASGNWGYTKELTSRYQYKFLSTPSKSADFSPQTIDVNKLPPTGEVKELNFETHRSELEKFIMEYYQFDENQAKGAVDNLENIKSQSVCHPLIFENDKLVGRVLAYYPTTDSKETVVLTNVLVRGDSEDDKQPLRERLYRYVVEKIQQVPEVKTVSIFASGPALENLAQYDKLGIEFTEVFSLYEKQIQ